MISKQKAFNKSLVCHCGHKMPNVYKVSDGHGFWPGAQRRHGRTLKKVFFKRLTSPRVAGVQEFLQTNAMDCVVWACILAITPDDEVPPPMPGTSVQQGDISEEEKERIRNMQLDESESEQEGS